MRNFKRFLTLALAMVMLVSAFAMGTSAAKFTDVDEENEYLAKAVNLLSYVGVTKGTTETTFGTEELVTREQMAAFIYRLMKKGNSVEGGSNTSAFTDLEDPTFFFMVSWANNQGIIKGTSATTFEPKGSITLQDAYTMIVRALGYENEETLAYPYGYIDVAEAKGVTLGEGLDSSVSYTDALTRGDVAVLLYNAFFAETGVAETKQVEKKIGGDDDNATWVLETVTHYPTFCEKYFDVIEVEYQAVATPMYTFGKDVKETTASFGYDVIDFREDKTDGDTDAPDQAYIAFEDLGLEGAADDYIMSHFTMYVIVDDGEIEEVLYAEPLMTVKNVNELKFATVSTNTKGSYLDTEYTVKALTGKVEFDGEVAYFYDAPYSYSTPKYTAVPKDKNGNPIKTADEHKYDERNLENLEIIEIKPLGTFDVEEPEYTLAVKNVTFEKYADIAADKYADASKSLIDTFKEAYVGGLFEADVYDVNGDGLYDYINYMPYKAYFVDADEDKTFFDNKYTTDGKKNVVYTEGAFLAGEEFEDEDFIIGYFDEAINYINVAAVVEPVNGSVTKFKAATGMITINGEKEVTVKDAWKVVANAEDKYAVDGNVAQNLVNVGYNVEKVQWNAFDNELLVAGVYDKEDVDFYVYEDVLLFQEGIDGTNKFDGQLVIVTMPEKGNSFIKDGNFNPVTGGETTYVHVWMDGEVKWVPFNTKNKVKPALNDTNKALYLGQLATYSEADGLYTIMPVANGSVKVDGEDLTLPAFDKTKFADEELADYQAYKTYTKGYLVKRSGQRYVLSEVATFDNSKRVEKDVEFILNDNTVILVKNTYRDADLETVVDYLEFTASDIKETVASELKNVQVILGNNVDYKNREDLLVLYAEFESTYASAEDYGDQFKLTKAKKSTKSERIVKMMNVEMNDDGKFYATYDVFNPYTGATASVVGTTTSTNNNYVSPYKVGDVVEVNSNDEIEDASRAADTKNIVSENNSAYYFVTGYSAAEETIELVKVPAGVTNETFDATIDNAAYITLDVSEAAVTVIAHQARGIGADMVRWGSLKVGDVAKLDGSEKSYLAVKTDYEPKPGASLKTVYGKYVKVYVDYDANSAADIAETGIDGEANFIIVVANSGEAEAHCDLD